MIINNIDDTNYYFVLFLHKYITIYTNKICFSI